MNTILASAFTGCVSISESLVGTFIDIVSSAVGLRDILIFGKLPRDDLDDALDNFGINKTKCLVQHERVWA